MSTPTPPDRLPRRPAGLPGAGQFTGRSNTAPAASLGDAHAAPSASSTTAQRADELDSTYRELWKRLNAHHRSSVYGDGRSISRTSTNPSELAILAHLADAEIAQNVARNAHTPAAVLHHLVLHGVDRGALTLALQHPNCDNATLVLAGRAPRTSDAAS